MRLRARGPMARALGRPMGALLAAALAVSLLVPATAGAASIRLGVLRHRADPVDARQHGPQRSQGRSRAHGPLPVAVGGDSAPKRHHLPVGSRGQRDRPPGPRRDPGGPDRLGQPEVGRESERHVAAADRLGQGQDGVAELRQGRRRALRAERLLLDPRLQADLRDERRPAADRLVPDLERAEPEEVLHPLPGAEGVRAAPPALQQRDQERRPEGQDRARRDARQRRRQGLDVPRRALQAGQGSQRGPVLRRRRAAPVRRHHPTRRRAR